MNAKTNLNTVTNKCIDTLSETVAKCDCAVVNGNLFCFVFVCFGCCRERQYCKEERQSYAERQQRSHPRDETEALVVTVAKHIKIGKKEKQCLRCKRECL